MNGRQMTIVETWTELFSNFERFSLGWKELITVVIEFRPCRSASRHIALLRFGNYEKPGDFDERRALCRASGGVRSGCYKKIWKLLAIDCTHLRTRNINEEAFSYHWQTRWSKDTGSGVAFWNFSVSFSQIPTGDGDRRLRDKSNSVPELFHFIHNLYTHYVGVQQ